MSEVVEHKKKMISRMVSEKKLIEINESQNFEKVE